MAGVLMIAGVHIQADNKGRVSLNDLHRASGDPQKKPGKWTQLKSTKELIAELNAQVSDMTLAIQHGGDRPGTYAHELLAVSYAGWMSPAFQLKVNQAFIDSRRPRSLAVVEQYPELKAIQELVITTAEARQRAEQAEALAHAAELKAAVDLDAWAQAQQVGQDTATSSALVVLRHKKGDTSWMLNK